MREVCLIRAVACAFRIYAVGFSEEFVVVYSDTNSRNRVRFVDYVILRRTFAGQLALRDCDSADGCGFCDRDGGGVSV